MTDMWRETGFSVKKSPRFLAQVMVLLILALLVVGCGGRKALSEYPPSQKLTLKEVKIEPSQLGEGWKLTKEISVDPASAEPGSTIELLVEVGALHILNQMFSRDQEKLQVNLVETDSSEEAQDVTALMMEEETGNLYGYTHNIAAEIITGSDSTRNKVKKLLDLKTLEEAPPEEKKSREYEVAFEFACVDDIDYMTSNDLSNYIEEYGEGQPVDPKMQAAIDSTKFGDKVRLLTKGGDELKARYEFDPVAISSLAGDGTTIFTFDPTQLKKKLGVPYVVITGEVEVGATDLDDGDGTKLDEREKDRYIAGTTFWPIDNHEVKSIVDGLTKPLKGDAKKVEALWKWVRDNIEYKGPAGTRYGTDKVLSQGYGRCWDKSDVFVTLSRAAGIPTREVAGWLADDSGGHVWAQAYIEGKGWVSVDTTNNYVGSDAGYVPFFATADGAMPILYVKAPTLEEK